MILSRSKIGAKASALYVKVCTHPYYLRAVICSRNTLRSKMVLGNTYTLQDIRSSLRAQMQSHHLVAWYGVDAFQIISVVNGDDSGADKPKEQC